MFDGDAQLYSTRKIEDQFVQSNAGQKQYTVEIRLTNELNINELNAQVYNVLAKKVQTFSFSFGMNEITKLLFRFYFS